VNAQRKGWLFVAVQAILLITLVALPGADAWSTPRWVELSGLALFGSGVAIGILAAVNLGRSLTPTPVPIDDGQLSTDGMYRFTRHPIYTGVLLIVTGITIPSGNWVTLALAIATFGFFNIKAAWEEQQLTEVYPDYPAYIARTGRFLPHIF
jgi:protein-S-isoprenylcysteine O-methyltransferase Ste14